MLSKIPLSLVKIKNFGSKNDSPTQNFIFYQKVPSRNCYHKKWSFHFCWFGKRNKERWKDNISSNKIFSIARQGFNPSDWKSNRLVLEFQQKSGKAFKTQISILNRNCSKYPSYSQGFMNKLHLSNFMK